MSGAAAAGGTLAAGTASAAVVQITLPEGNEVTNLGISSALNSLNPDITGDGTDDLESLQIRYGPVNQSATDGFILWNLFVEFSSIYNLAIVGGRRQNTTFGFVTSYSVDLTGPFTGFQSTPQDKVAIVPITFSDSRINGGIETTGFLEVRAFNTSLFESTVRLVRLVFDDASPFRPNSGVVAGGTNREWGEPAPAEIADSAVRTSRLNRQVKKLKKKLKKLRRDGNSQKAKKIKAKIKKAQKRLRGS